ncbi:MAG: aspartate/glutamate racemase family protein [Thermodesulfobacteriota bacterium]
MIGFIDSSLAGLEVVRAFRDHLPGHDLLFFADTARGPYSGKSLETIQRFAEEGIQKLSDLGATRIIASCPAISSLAAAGLIGSPHVPIVNIVEPAAEEAVHVSKRQQIGILGANNSLEADAYQKMIWKFNANAKVFTASSALIESVAAEGWMNKPQAAMIAKKYLHPLRIRQIDTLILARPDHRPMMKIIQRKIGKRVRIIEPWEITAARTSAESITPESAVEKAGNLRVFVTDLSFSLEKYARIFYDRKIRMEKSS